jgi:hypothetical protein
MAKSIPKLALAVTILSLGLAVAIHGRRPVHAAGHQDLQACSLSTLHGRYGYAVSGFINTSNNPGDVTIPTFVPFAEEAYFDFDGRGNISGASLPNFGGQIDPSVAPSAFAGTYLVDSSTCTGALTINASFGATFHRSLIILEDAQEIGFVSTDPGLVISGTYKKQFTNQTAE